MPVHAVRMLQSSQPFGTLMFSTIMTDDKDGRDQQHCRPRRHAELTLILTPPFTWVTIASVNGLTSQDDGRVILFYRNPTELKIDRGERSSPYRFEALLLAVQRRFAGTRRYVDERNCRRNPVASGISAQACYGLQHGMAVAGQAGTRMP